MVKGFTMLLSYYEAVRPLPDEQRLLMLDAIMDYVFLEKEPVDLPPILKGYFTLLRPNIDSSMRHYSASVENGKKGGRPRNKPSGNPVKTQDKPSENREKEKEKEKEKERDVKADKPRTLFVPPSVDDVTGYCKKQGYALDAETFVDFYTAKGWKVGKESMKDWKAAVRTWERRNGKKESEANDGIII